MGENRARNGTTKTDERKAEKRKGSSVVSRGPLRNPNLYGLHYHKRRHQDFVTRKGFRCRYYFVLLGDPKTTILGQRHTTRREVRLVVCQGEHTYRRRGSGYTRRTCVPTRRTMKSRREVNGDGGPRCPIHLVRVVGRGVSSRT